MTDLIWAIVFFAGMFLVALGVGLIWALPGALIAAGATLIAMSLAREIV